MSSYSIYIENDTDMTPDIRNIQLTHCAWVYPQELEDGQSIAGRSAVVGMVEPTVGHSEYSGTLTVHYYHVPPGPGSGEVNISFGVEQLPNSLTGSIAAEATNALLTVAWQVVREDGDHFIGTVTIT